MAGLRPFHLAVTVDDLDSARRFYGDLLGCVEGRSDARWVDFNLFGHQFVCHLDEAKQTAEAHNHVDGHGVPVPHYGVVLNMADWQALAERLAGEVEFVIPPTVRFRDAPGEQATMFFRDPAGNALEFKAFGNDAMLFETG